MKKESKIEAVKKSLPQMGLVDRFFFLVNELYQNYFDEYDEHHKGYRKEEIFHEWSEEDQVWESHITEGSRAFHAEESLYHKFLQNFGDKELKNFILNEIHTLTSIFRQRYSCQLSFIYNPYSNKAYYLSGDSEFLILAPFFFDEASFKAVIIHELSISEIDDRKYLLSKYQAALEEIKYRINKSYVWDAGFESGRTIIVGDIVFPERNVMSLENLSSYLIELQETSLVAKFLVIFCKSIRMKKKN